MASQPTARGGLTLGHAVRVFLFLLLGLIIVDLIVAYHRPLWKAYDPNFYAARLEGCQGREFDLIVAGGSPVAEGVDTRILAGVSHDGISLDRTYSMSFLGGTATEVWHGVVNGITSPPKLMIYGITATDINDSRDEPEGARSLMNLGDVVGMTWHRPSRVTWFGRHFAVEQVGRCWQLWYHRNAIRLWAADQFDHIWPGPFADVAAEARQGLQRSATLAAEHAYAPDPATQTRRFSRFTRKHRDSLVFPHLVDYRVGEHLHYVHRLLNWAKDRDVDLILVDMPVSAELEKRHPREFAAYRHVLKTMSEERGVPVLWATRDAVDLTDADFGDLIHLNAAGSTKLSNWLRQQIETSTASVVQAGGARP